MVLKKNGLQWIIRPCKINYLVLRYWLSKKMMRGGGYLIFVFICILVQSVGFSSAQILYSSSICYFHNKPRVMTWNPVKNGHRNQLWFHFIDCYYSELLEVTTSYNQRKTQECSEFLQREIGVVFFFYQFKLKGAKIWTRTFLPLYLFLFGDKYKPAADFMPMRRYLRTR